MKLRGYLIVSIVSVLVLVLCQTYLSNAEQLSPLTIDWVGALLPESGSVTVVSHGSSVDIYILVYKVGTTDTPGRGAGIQCEISWSPVSYFGGPWDSIRTKVMQYESDVDNYDKYRGTLDNLITGKYEFTARCSDDNGLNWSWSELPFGNGMIAVGMHIPGYSTGTTSNLMLMENDIITISASGSVNTYPESPDHPWSDPDGNGNPCTSECLLPAAQFGALIGRIGNNGQWFFIGTQNTINVEQGGELILAVNDTINDNNIGSYVVYINKDFFTVYEARLDVGMPYNIDRGCASPYVGCNGSYHGFYNGVCTDLAMDAYRASVFFNIQTALSQDFQTNPNRYRYGTARNAEDMRRYFTYNQELLQHSQPYQIGDIAFFDWPREDYPDGDGISDHVNIISRVDSNGRPLKMVDATGTYSGNPSGLALEHNWSSYYDLYNQGHGRLSQIFAEMSDVTGGTLPILRVSLISSPSVVFSVFDANGKFRSSDYEENLVASNIEDFIPYIPSSNYSENDVQQVITINYPLSNSNRYIVRLEGSVSTTYNLLIETLENSIVTDSELFTQPIASGEVHRVEITLNDNNGNIEFSAIPPIPSPFVSAPFYLTLADLVGTLAQLTFTISETGGQYPINGIAITCTELSDQLGGVIPASNLLIIPDSFDIVANGSQEISAQVDLSSVSPGIYQGSLIISTQNGGSYRVLFVLDIEFHKIYLPIVTKQ